MPNRLIPLGVLLILLIATTGVGMTSAEPAAAAEVAVVQGDEVRLRSSPVMADNVVGHVSKGERLAVVGRSGDWVQVRRVDGSTAWIAGWLVRVEQQTRSEDSLRQGEVEVHVNGRKISFPDQPPFIDGATGRTYVPLRFVSEALGAQVDWDGIQKVVRVQKGAVVVQMQVGAETARVNGKDVSLDAPARLAGNRTLVPLRFVSEILEAEVNWLEPQAGRPGRVEITARNREEATDRVAVVQGDGVRLRSSPVIADNIVGHVSEGERLAVVGRSGDWVQVRRGDGSTAWIAGWLVRVEEALTLPEESSSEEPPAAEDGEEPAAAREISGTATVRGESAEVYSRPGNRHTVIALAFRGYELELVSQQGDWYQVRLTNGTLGWLEKSAVIVDHNPAFPSRGDDRGDLDPSADFNYDIKVVEDRVVISVQSTAPITYSVFKLTSPGRIVVDIEGLAEEFAGEPPPGLVLASPVAEQIRTGWENGRFRLVCDLKEALSRTRYKSALSGDRRNLTVEVFLVDGAMDDRVIVLDPGHGGSDPGAIGPTGLEEKDVCLDIAREAARLLRQEGARVVLTRNADEFVALDRRAEIANQAGADVFVSIHSNANVNRAKQGLSTYYWPYPESATPGQAAARRELARALQQAVVEELGLEDLGLFEERFMVLRASEAPSALVEVAFISNPQEEVLLRDPEFRRRAGAAIARGIIEYFHTY